MKFKKLYILFAFAATICGASGEELLDVKFTPEKPPKSKMGIQKIVKINDLPKFSYALHLQTVKRNDKFNYAGWSRKFAPGNGDKFIIDYWIKLDKHSRYGLFVKDKRRQMVALLFKKGRIVCNNGGTWMKNGPIYKIGKWQHIRYVINCVARKYDVFLNDMQTPIVKGYKFRHANAKIPDCIWIESDELHESTTLLGGVKIKDS